MVRCSKCKSKLEENFYIEDEWDLKPKIGPGEFDIVPVSERVVVCAKCGHRIPEAKIREFGLEEVFFR